MGEGEGVPAQVLASLGVEADAIRRLVATLIADSGGTLAPPHRQEPVLRAEFGRNLTEQAREGWLSPVLGREAEIARLAEALAPGASGVPVLIGEHGVGIGAIVRGLARSAHGPDAPAWLTGRDIREVDARTLINPEHRRDRAIQRLTAVARYFVPPGTGILFVRNAFAPVPVADGSVLAVAVLRPVLERGRLIVAATPAEYRRESARTGGGFHEIPVEELAEPLVAEVLRAERERYESRHRVEIPDAALTSAVTQSSRFTHDRPLPTRALDLLDLAAARAARRIGSDLIAEAKDAITEIRARKNAAIDAQEFELAASMRERERELISAQDALEQAWTNMPAHRIVRLTEDDIAQALAAHSPSAAS
jgi:ATP-dependent Clp protease ATP-binding subunit ClpC